MFDYLNKMAETASAFGVTLYHENEKEIYGDTADRVLNHVKRKGAEIRL
ncbi:MAG: hypothetical protein ACLRSW_02880 [Christensenellaceae bacterium]